MSGPAANPYMAAQRAWDDTGDWEMAVEAALTVARQRGAAPQPAAELAASMAESRQLRELVIDMLTGFGVTGRVTAAQIAAYRKRAGLAE